MIVLCFLSVPNPTASVALRAACNRSYKQRIAALEAQHSHSISFNSSALQMDKLKAYKVYRSKPGHSKSVPSC